MKRKNFLTLAGSVLLFVIFILTSCIIPDDNNNNNDNNNDDSTICEGYVSATATGFLNKDYCMTSLSEYSYQPGNRVYLTAGITEDSVYCMVEVGTDSLPFTGPGTYKCGGNEAGYVELTFHGSNSEFYKPDSGSVTVTVADSSSFKAEFDVRLKGYYNQQTINLKGKVDY